MHKNYLPILLLPRVKIASIKFFLFLNLYFLVIFNTYAFNNFPNVEGSVFMQSRLGLVDEDSNSSASYKDGVDISIEPKFSLNINNNWSVKTSWDISRIVDRSEDNGVNSVFIDQNNGYNLNDYAIIVEELKADFKNEDLNFFFGKYNPAFGSAWDNSKRIGILTHDFTQDYELTEKIGFGFAALLDDGGSISVNTFFNDTTGLSNSAIHRRGRNRSDNNIAGNNNNLSSYSIAFSGNNLFDVDELRYNLGYRDIDVESQYGYDNEKGMVAGLEYKMPISYRSYFIPFTEIAKVDNFGGIAGKDILYSTTSLVLEYSNWKLGFTGVIRDIKDNSSQDYTDNQLQYFLGYKFANSVMLDVSHIDLEQSDIETEVFAIALSYLYSF